ncbi:MAG: methyltransferase domain-containing protein, partial [Bacteroidetes bacterium]
MKPPLWKKLLSYLTEIHLESAPSDINPHLYVSLSRGRYQLSTANAIYSYADLYDNYRQAFERLDLPRRRIERVLVLGFGLGSVPWLLEKTFKQNYHYTGVEIDENVIYLANKYVLPELQSPVEIFCADAFAFAFQHAEQYDLIAMDVFLDDLVPPHFEDTAFLEALRALLRDDGFLLYNRLALTDEDRRLSRRFFEVSFKQ